MKRDAVEKARKRERGSSALLLGSSAVHGQPHPKTKLSWDCGSYGGSFSAVFLPSLSFLRLFFWFCSFYFHAPLVGCVRALCFGGQLLTSCACCGGLFGAFAFFMYHLGQSGARRGTARRPQIARQKRKRSQAKLSQRRAVTASRLS